MAADDVRLDHAQQQTFTPEADREWIPFSPTDRVSFVSNGGPGTPEFFEERGQRGDGPPLHRHEWPTWELILSGTVRFQIDGEEVRAGAGDVVYTPPNAVHGFVVESDQARVIGVGTSEGRFARLQRAAAPLTAAEGGPDMDAIVELAGRTGVEVLGPPLEPRG